MELVVERCSGLDVGKDEVVACVRVPEALADWLAAEGVTQLVMEATGQYWKPIW